MADHFTSCGPNWPPSKTQHKELFLRFSAVGTLTFFQESHTQARKHTRPTYVYMFVYPGTLTTWFDVEADWKVEGNELMSNAE